MCIPKFVKGWVGRLYILYCEETLIEVWCNEIYDSMKKKKLKKAYAAIMKLNNEMTYPPVVVVKGFYPPKEIKKKK